MSRSFRHTPITGTTTAKSEKEDKRINNRRIRRKTREEVRNNNEDIYVENKKLADIWSWNKDGKMTFFGKENDEWYVKLMRK